MNDIILSLAGGAAGYALRDADPAMKWLFAAGSLFMPAAVGVGALAGHYVGTHPETFRGLLGLFGEKEERPNLEVVA